jgi:hypothetical protein
MQLAAVMLIDFFPFGKQVGPVTWLRLKAA